MWCFALMVPGGGEHALLAAQYSNRIGIFACDDYTVFSNDTVPLVAPAASTAMDTGGGGLLTSPIGGSLSVRLGGKWGTAMNTDIFVRVWAAVVKLARFQQHPWTVKADPDTVFVPARLRQLLATEPPGAVYLNNCKYGLHGPIEVLSREAVAVYANRSRACEGFRIDAMDTSHPHDDEDHAFGEDQFLNVCLDAVGVRRVDELQLLLSERACGHWSDNVACDEGKVAFHPFKDIQSYFTCWGAARQSTLVWEEALAAVSAGNAPAAADAEGAAAGGDPEAAVPPGAGGAAREIRAPRL